MKRRSFLKGAALAGLAAAAGVPVTAQAMDRKRTASAPEPSPAADLSYGEDGKFTLLQFTDTHYIAGDPRSERAKQCVCEALDAVKPDLVIHTGDILYGKPDIPSAIEILSPMAERGIPFAVALGNHDSQFGSTREDVYAAIRSLPGCLNTAPKEGVYGCSNDVITLSSGGKVDRALYLFDSMDAVKLKGEEDIHSYDYIRFSQLGWYRDWSARLRLAAGGVPVPALAFFHIPLCEVNDGLASEGSTLTGNNCEPPCPSRVNSGLLAQMREMGDVQAIVNGHDHDCDYVLHYMQMYFIYGRFSGCDTVYNHLGQQGVSGSKVSGCRIFQFRPGSPAFTTWVRLQGGEVQQLLTLE